MSFDPTPYAFGPAALYWLVAIGVFAAIAVMVALAVSVLTQGVSGFAFVGHQLADGARDFTHMSFRRIWALAVLTFKESFRRKTLLVFVVFALLFMFGGWFLANATDRADLQIKVYTSFVLTAISWLILPVALLLSCWGLPQDIKDRSLHTVVTKPTRRNEIVIGRFLGFALIGTMVLLIMSLVGYFWILRNFPSPTQTTEIEHDGTTYAVTATLDHDTEVDVRNADTGETAEFVAPNDQQLRLQLAESYPPEVVDQVDQFLRELRASGPVLVSRVPIYGQLSFTTREGNPGQGINTGDIWEFRGYIEGATKASALWEFDGITADRLGDSLLFESHFESFRTHKGRMGQGLTAEVRLLNDLRSQTAAALNAGDEFKTASDLVNTGEFAQAGSELTALADGLEKEQVELAAAEFEAVAEGYSQLAEVLDPLARQKETAELAKLRDATADAAAAGEAKNSAALAAALKEMGGQFQEKADLLQQHVTDLIVPLPTFEVQEFRENLMTVQRNIQFYDQDAKTVRTVDLFDDLTHGGKLRVRVLCLDPGQYIGMARPDLFVRTPDEPFAAGFFKGVGGIWMMMVLIVALGVTASTFVKGPVAILLTFTLLILGATGFHGFLDELVSGEWEGGGTTESAIRLVRHLNPTVPLEESTGLKVVKTTDTAIGGGLWLVHKIVPNFHRFRFTEYVANGFDVPLNAAIFPAATTLLAYLIPCLFIGYYSLKLRELEAK